MSLSPKIIHLSQVMSPDERAIAEALENAGWLEKTVTYWTEGGFPMLERLSSVRDSIRSKRPAPNIRPEHLLSVPLSDILPYGLGKLGMVNSAVSGWDMRSSWLARKASRLLRPDINCAIGRAHASLSFFQKAKELGMVTLLHHPHTHHQMVSALLDKEEALFPGICSSSFDEDFAAPERTEKFEAELLLADAVICPSEFSAKSVSAAQQKPTTVGFIPYGCTLSAQKTGSRDAKTFLIAGNLTARKGVHRVLRAWKKLRAHQTHRLKLVGDMHLSPAFLRDFRGTYEHIPRMPRNELLAEYSRSAALILNALAEGMPNVILEALGCGTPVLVSRNSGAEGFITDGVEGRLYDFGDDDALCETLEWALSNPVELAEMGCNARLFAEKWTWNSFQEAFITWVSQQCDQRHSQTLR